MPDLKLTKMVVAEDRTTSLKQSQKFLAKKESEEEIIPPTKKELSQDSSVTFSVEFLLSYKSLRE